MRACETRRVHARAGIRPHDRDPHQHDPHDDVSAADHEHRRIKQRHLQRLVCVDSRFNWPGDRSTPIVGGHGESIGKCIFFSIAAM
jgi:hypothetical protein